MSTIGGNNSIQDGLVFAYDTGNKLKSFRGEPTTNLIEISKQEDYSTWSTSRADITEVNQSSPTNSKVYKLINQNDGLENRKRTLVSVDITMGLKYTSSVYLKAYGFTRVTIFQDGGDLFDEGTYYGSGTKINLLDGSVNNSLVKVTYAGDGWYLCEFTITASVDATNITLLEIVALNDSSAGVNTTMGDGISGILISGAQIEQKPHVTPFTPNTRTTTNSLLDLTKNTTIDVTNTSFDSEGQMFFDGVDDTIALPSLNISSSSGSIEIVISRESDNSNAFIFSKVEASTNRYYIRQPSTGVFDAVRGNPIASATFGTILMSKFYHLVMVWDSSTIYTYKNGDLRDSVSYTNPNTDLTSGDVGSGPGSNLGMKLPITKIYNKALTPQEVKRNFQAIRSRFNI